MRTITFPLPILPGQEEAWRRGLQEMLDVYYAEYEALRQRLGVTRLVLWLAEAPRGSLVIVQVEAQEIETLLPKLATSELPFERWVCQRMLELHGIDLAHPTRIVTELVLAG